MARWIFTRKRKEALFSKARPRLKKYIELGKRAYERGAR